ncbi:MAG: hypothetical protein LQ347_002789 [Umbilicaria vellea]|nr:MAG: hypothetical protein LQ347_002789 [Umbilicaria vellea]
MFQYFINISSVFFLRIAVDQNIINVNSAKDIEIVLQPTLTLPIQIICGGVTAYTALKRSAVKPGQRVVLPGAGGGLGHFAVQYAKAMDMRVIAIDGGAEKEVLGKNLGAEHYIGFTTEKDIVAKVRDITTLGAHGIIVLAASKSGYDAVPRFLRVGSTVVAVGLPKGEFSVGATPFRLVLGKLNIMGSVTGTLNDVDEALEFNARGLVKPILVRGSMRDINHLSEQMLAGKVFGRAVIDLWASLEEGVCVDRLML